MLGSKSLTTAAAAAASAAPSATLADASIAATQAVGGGGAGSATTSFRLTGCGVHDGRYDAEGNKILGYTTGFGDIEPVCTCPPVGGAGGGGAARAGRIGHLGAGGRAVRFASSLHNELGLVSSQAVVDIQERRRSAAAYLDCLARHPPIAGRS